MTAPPLDPRIELLNLTDELVDDLLSLSDEEFMAECKDNFSPEISAKIGIEALERAEGNLAKRKLLAAKAGVSSEKKASRRPSQSSAAEARERFSKAVQDNPKLGMGITLAARKGTGYTDADIVSIVEDLEELGLIPPSTNDK